LLDFANSKALDPRITFTRASTATYWDGHTTAKAEENLITNSETFNWTTKARTTVAYNVATAPDGTTTADSITDNGTSGTHYINDTTTLLTKQFTYSVYAKANTLSIISLWVSSIGNGTAYFNLSSGTVGTVNTGSYVASAAISSVGNGWYRCSITSTSATFSGTIYPVIGLHQADNTQSYTGSGQSVYVWGAQYELRSSATTYTPTTSFPITKYQPVLQTAASGVPRFDHDPVTGESKGLLIEEAKLNQLTNSTELDSLTVAGALTRYLNVAYAPDGTKTADRGCLTVTSGVSTQNRFSIESQVTTGASTYTLSCFAKADGLNYLGLTIYDGTAYRASTTFNLSNGTIGTNTAGTNKIQSVGNGWYRVSVTGTVTGDLPSANNASGFWPHSIDMSAAQAETLNDSYKGVLLWGFQFENSPFATSYIPTSGAAATRSLELAKMTDTSYYNYAEGSIYGRYTPAKTGLWRTVARIGNAANDSDALYLRISSSGAKEFQTYSRGNLEANIESSGAGNYVEGTEVIGIGGYITDNFATYWDNTLVGIDTSVAVPSNVDVLNIGGDFNGSNNINGTIKKIAYYPKRLSNAELQALTEE
jgi:hypothetical protein